MPHRFVATRTPFVIMRPPRAMKKIGSILLATGTAMAAMKHPAGTRRRPVQKTPVQKTRAPLGWAFWLQWVLATARPGSPEASESRQWLARAGLLPQRLSAPVGSTQAERQVGHAVLTGRALFAENGGKAEPMRRLQLFLVGQPDSPTKEERYNLRTAEDGSFTFPSVVPGSYMITNRVAGQPIWRLRVELKPGEEKQLDLMNDNSVAARDDFPQPR